MFRFLLGWLIASSCFWLAMTTTTAQDSTLILTSGAFNTDQLINLSTRREWVFQPGHNPHWADPKVKTHGWMKRSPSSLSSIDADKTGRVEGWFRIRLRLDSSFKDLPLGIQNSSWAAYDLYIDGHLKASFGNTGTHGKPYAEYYPYSQPALPIELTAQQDHLIALHVVDYVSPFSTDRLKSELERGTSKLIRLVGPSTFNLLRQNASIYPIFPTIWLSVSFLLAILFWLLTFLSLYERSVIRLLAISETFLVFNSLGYFLEVFQPPFFYEVIVFRLSNISLGMAIAFLPLILWHILKYPTSRPVNMLTISISLVGSSISAYTNDTLFGSVAAILQVGFFLWLLLRARKKLQGAQWAIVVGSFLTLTFAFWYALLLLSGANSLTPSLSPIATGFYLALPLSFLVYITLRFQEILAEDRAMAAQVLQITQEKQDLLRTQNELLEQQVEARTAELKASQTQLIQKEKLASLGELTAGIAHEIQNPLNFVNNFSEVSTELVNELEEEHSKPQRDIELEDELLNDLKQNLQKISHHGSRASSIVKGMLEHSRPTIGEPELTDLNALTDEYLRLAYHGQRSKDKDFSCELLTQFDPATGPVKLTAQEIGRVLLNLFTNAFYAVRERSKQLDANYKPLVTVMTQRTSQSVEVRVIDNGTGIPLQVQEKIFQPFFTTKPTGEGTGLGLSLSYDIVTKGHGGSLTVESQEGEGTAFVIQLPALS